MRIKQKISKASEQFDKELKEIAIERMKGIDKQFRKLIGVARLQDVILRDKITKEHWNIIKKRLINDVPRSESII